MAVITSDYDGAMLIHSAGLVPAVPLGGGGGGRGGGAGGEDDELAAAMAASVADQQPVDSSWMDLPATVDASECRTAVLTAQQQRSRQQRPSLFSSARSARSAPSAPLKVTLMSGFCAMPSVIMRVHK